jgi:hypothetical protein
MNYMLFVPEVAEISTCSNDNINLTLCNLPFSMASNILTLVAQQFGHLFLNLGRTTLINSPHRPAIARLIVVGGQFSLVEIMDAALQN